jgi:hypothetical protein
MNEEQKARQALYDARGSQHQVQPVPVLTPEVLAKVRTLSRAKQVEFMRRLDFIRTLPKEMFAKAFVQLWRDIFINSGKQSGLL